MQHAMAEQREAAAAHRSAAHTEEFVVEFGGDCQPERAIGLGRHRLIDQRRQSHPRKNRLCRLIQTPQAVEGLLDKGRCNHASLDFGHRALSMAKLSEIMEQFCHRLQ